MFYEHIPAKAAFDWLPLLVTSPLGVETDNYFTKESALSAFQDFH